MQFIAGEAGQLPLQPPLDLTAPQMGRVQCYAAAIAARLAAVASHLQQGVAGGSVASATGCNMAR